MAWKAKGLEGPGQRGAPLSLSFVHKIQKAMLLYMVYGPIESGLLVFLAGIAAPVHHLFQPVEKEGKKLAYAWGVGVVIWIGGSWCPQLIDLTRGQRGYAFQGARGRKEDDRVVK